MITPALPQFNVEHTMTLPVQEGEFEESRLDFRSFASQNTSEFAGTKHKQKSRTLDDSSALNRDNTEWVINPVKEGETEYSSREEDYVPNNFVSKTFSAPYVRHQTGALITKLVELIELWRTQGTKNSISEISQIKNLIERYAEYLEQTPETEILLGSLEMIFEDNNWETLSDEQLESMKSQLESFQSGTVKWASLKRFSRAMWNNDVL